MPQKCPGLEGGHIRSGSSEPKAHRLGVYSILSDVTHITLFNPRSPTHGLTPDADANVTMLKNDPFAFAFPYNAVWRCWPHG